MLSNSPKKIRHTKTWHSKFWEHFLYIANAINHLGNDGVGMWDEQDVGASHQTGWTGIVAKLLQQSGEGESHAAVEEPLVEVHA